MHNVRLYGAGGCGTNIALALINTLGGPTSDNLTICCIDTGVANVHRSGLDVKDIMEVISDEDGKMLSGSGSIRKSNYQHIVRTMPKILHRFNPAEINIIVMSGAGGSGSTIGPVLLDNLLSAGQNAIVIYVDSADSLVEVKNTSDTIKSMNNIATKHHRTVPVIFQDNQQGQGVVDSAIIGLIPILTKVVSDEVETLDVVDVRNFLNFMNFPLLEKYGPGLTMMSVLGKDDLANIKERLVCALSLTTREISARIDSPLCPHQTIGHLSSNAFGNAAVFPIHLVQFSSQQFQKAVSTKEELLNSFHEDMKVHEKPTIKNSGASAESDGMVF